MNIKMLIKHKNDSSQKKFFSSEWVPTKNSFVAKRVFEAILYVGVIFQLNTALAASTTSSPYTDKGVIYAKEALDAYAKINHGPDAELFVDPSIKQFLENSRGEKVLDVGCGAGDWSLYAAQYAAEVYGVDFQEDMIKNAEIRAKNLSASEKVHFAVGDATNLIFRNNFFDRVISLGLGCNLTITALEAHIAELKRVLKPGGVCFFSVPASLHVVFTDDSVSEADMVENIKKKLDTLPNNPSSDLIFKSLKEIEGMRRATFFLENNRLTLLTEKKKLVNGRDEWRKIRDTVVANRYYEKEFYISLFEKHGFKIEKIEENHFSSEKERQAYNAKVSPEKRLGSSYVNAAPVLVFYLKA